MNDTVTIILALLGILVGAFAVIRNREEVSGLGVILIGLAVLLPVVFK